MRLTTRAGSRAAGRAPSAAAIAVWACAALGVAGYTAPAAAQQHSVTRYTNADGLPQAQCLSVFQDRDGYLWFGTYGGVARYDGDHFEVYTSAEGLVGNVVVAIAQDDAGRLYFGTSEGLTTWDGGTFREIVDDAGQPIAGVQGIFVDRDGSRWVATRYGLHHQRDDTTRRYTEADGLPNASVWTTYRDAAGVLWAGTELGLAKLADGRFEALAGNSPGRLSVRALIEVDGSLLIGTMQGAFRRAGEAFARIESPAFAGPGGNEIYAIAADPNGSLWFATGAGTVYSHQRGYTRIGARNGLSSDRIRAVIADREGNLWFGTDAGAAKLVMGPFVGYNTSDGLPHDFVRDVAEDRHGRIWVATREGVGTIDPDGTISSLGAAEGLLERRVYSVLALPDDSILFGTSGSLYHLRDGVIVDRRTVADGLPSGFVRTVEEDGDNGAWIGTDAGLAHWSDDEITPVGNAPPLDIVVLERDRSGALWVGTIDGKLFRYDGRGLQRMAAGLGLEGVTLWSLAAADDGGIWVGTNGLGAVKIRGDEVTRVSARDGLANDFVWQVFPDSAGRTWFYTNRGLDRWDGDDFMHFDLADGLLDLEGSANAVLEDSRGNIWFGSGQGLVEYLPSHEFGPAISPVVHIEAAVAGGKALPFANAAEILLPRSRNSVSLSYAGLSFHDESRLRYRHRLIGLDDAWSAPTAERSVSFVGLPAGSYAFEVVSMGPHGTVSESPARLSFVIEPGWTETTAVRAALLLALLGAIGGGYRWRYRHVEREKRRLAVAVDTRSRELAQSEQRLRTALLGTPAFAFHQDAELRYTWVHNALADLAAAEMLGATDRDLFDAVSAETLEGLKREVLASGAGVRREIEIERAHDGYWLDLTVEPLYEAGRIAGITGTAWDITEKRALEARLRQSQKMEAIGQLAGGVAHDFNNLLTGINGYAQLGMGQLPGDSPVVRDLEQVLRCSNRAARLTHQLLAFSRRQPLEPTVIDMNLLVTDTLKLLRRVIGEDIQLKFTPTPGLGVVRVDRGQVEQVLMNLAVNSRDAMSGGGTLTIALRNAVLGPEDEERFPGASAGDFVCMSVSDTGSGIDAEVQERIFEPFFTTKEVGKGTGLGLSTVYGIVRQHGGSLALDSAPGRGTTFEIAFPRVYQAPDDYDRDDKPAAETGGPETILLVEDEDAVRNVAREWLTGLGYEVLTAGDPAEAIEVFRARAGRIDMLLTDIVMPGQKGPDLYEELAQCDPSLKVLYMSGYAARSYDPALPPHVGRAFLAKPFSLGTLAAKLRSVLDAPPQELVPETAAERVDDGMSRPTGNAATHSP